MEQAWAVGKRYYRGSMSVRKLSVALEEAVASGASRAAERRGMSLSAWLNAAALALWSWRRAWRPFAPGRLNTVH